MKTALRLALAAAVLLAAAAPACSAPQEKTADKTPAPDFTVSDLQGRTFSLADFKGKVLFLNFWATWCPPCRQEIPDFIAAYKDLKGDGLEIVGLSVDRLTAAELVEWVKDVGINYPVALATREHVRAFQPGDYIPTTIVIDPEGNIRHRHVGALDKERLLELFKRYK